jgi:hypothetical protein
VLVEHLREHHRNFLCRDLAFRRELDADDATVVGRALAPAEALGFEPIEQARHRARVALRLTRQLGDRRGTALLQHEQRRPLRVGDALGLQTAARSKRDRHQGALHQPADALVGAVADGLVEASVRRRRRGLTCHDDNIHA